MGCGASVEADDGGWGKSDSEVRDGVFTGSTRARAAPSPSTRAPRAINTNAPIRSSRAR